MKLVELFENVILEEHGTEFDVICEDAKPVWARSGNKVVRKYRCTSGKKQGQIVSDPTTCGSGLDLKKSMRMKKLLSQKKASLVRKSKKRKTKDPVSIRVQKLNKQAGR